MPKGPKENYIPNKKTEKKRETIYHEIETNLYDYIKYM